MVEPMCATPRKLTDGRVIICRECRQCLVNRLNDVVGRALAEKRSAVETVALTCTYNNSAGINAALLVYKDVQNLFKRLRKDGFDVRYIAVGEYGSLKGRAHWHIALFVHNRRLEVPLKSNFHWKYWPHGFTWAQHSDYGGFSYILKYIQKGLPEGGAFQSTKVINGPHYSKGRGGRPLGADFFLAIVDDMVQQGLPLHSSEYAFADVTARGKDGKQHPRKFFLTGRLQELFFERYVSEWGRVHGTLPPETDYLKERYLDRVARKEMDLDPYLLERDFEWKREERLASRPPEAPLHTDARQVAFLITDKPGPGLVCFYSDGSAIYNDGAKSWRMEAGSSVSIADQLRQVPLGRLRAVVGEWIDRQAAALWSEPPAKVVPRCDLPESEPVAPPRAVEVAKPQSGLSAALDGRPDVVAWRERASRRRKLTELREQWTPLRRLSQLKPKGR